jgi:cell division septation protein DedD
MKLKLSRFLRDKVKELTAIFTLNGFSERDARAKALSEISRKVSAREIPADYPLGPDPSPGEIAADAAWMRRMIMTPINTPLEDLADYDDTALRSFLAKDFSGDVLDKLVTEFARLRDTQPAPLAPPNIVVAPATFPPVAVEPAPRRASPQVRRGTPPAKPTPPPAPQQSWPLLYVSGGSRAINLNDEFPQSLATYNWLRSQQR